MTLSIPRREAALYLAPLREGGSLPAVVETAEGERWVVKFRGAGQGPRALVAEIIVGALAEALGLRVPDRALVLLDPTFGQGERDPEIQDVLAASRGVNVGLRYLDGAFNLDPVAIPERVDPGLATALVWLDALVLNPDRSARNPNLMFWESHVWLIDHGAALYFHHDWARLTPERLRAPLPSIRDHVLLSLADDLTEADAALAAAMTPGVIRAAVDQVPDDLLEDPLVADPELDSPDASRARYAEALLLRLQGREAYLAAAEAARREARETPRRRLEARR